MMIKITTRKTKKAQKYNFGKISNKFKNRDVQYFVKSHYTSCTRCTCY